MAGFFIVVAMIFSNVVGNVFQGSDPAWGKLLGGIVFAIAVLLIVFIGAELFTGNNLVICLNASPTIKSIVDTGWKSMARQPTHRKFRRMSDPLRDFRTGSPAPLITMRALFVGNKLSIPVGQMFFRLHSLTSLSALPIVACGMKCKNEARKFS